MKENPRLLRLKRGIQLWYKIGFVLTIGCPLLAVIGLSALCNEEVTPLHWIVAVVGICTLCISHNLVCKGLLGLVNIQLKKDEKSTEEE